MQIAIVLYPGFTALDVVGPYEVLKLMPDAEVRFVAHEEGPVLADSGALSILATGTFADVERPDIVLVPGSSNSTTAAMEDPVLQEWLVKVHETTTWTTSVCTGALVIGAAGILRGLPATTHWTVQDQLADLGAESRPNDRIVRDGKVATAAGVSAGIDLALWLAGEICGEDRARMIQLVIEYDPQPPFDSGHPRKVTEDFINRTFEAMVP
ncbi:glutamine amidotransferase [Rhodococcus sp. 05-2256-B2]|uniref:DJ-1/PfpI family protein n=1 Tax=Nocardiaceae TaxID=85025 RepID=UPI00068C9326|nr:MULTISPECIES: DJ-1/PfpI family protein [Rhodococcus]MBY4383777.1 DJ-1/PfpI family protein [Rhodococcus fascians]MBY4398988.1 DJ-1/PfpI family protein [Rhodococcus fascians]MBY4408526.1 DJ-1/PfpI family protein [Rhodococcus fascians]MBY4423565.1 DJ-1/PfpI family protein [Rhodococcus fascians]MBY4462911.1 DJ-1/PfpI family protein [Rhodococcus fascians]